MPESLSTRLTKEEQRRQRQNRRKEEQEKVLSRRKFIQRGGFVLGSILLAGTGGLMWQIGARLLQPPHETGSRPQDRPRTPEEFKKQHQEDASSLAQLIAEADRGIETLQGLIADKLVNLPPEQQQEIRSPIEFYRNNQRNPIRNSYTFLLDDLEKRGEAALRSPAYLQKEDPRFFFMRLLKERVNLAGTFNPVARTFYLDKSVSSQNLFDALVIYHEAEHARQDYEVRSHLGIPELKQHYDSFYSVRPTEQPRIIIPFEYQAYTKELEVINLLTDGKLKQDSMGGNFSVDEYAKSLNARADQKGAIDWLLKLAQVYYSTDSRVNYYSIPFQQTINQTYEDQGISLYRLADPSTFDVRPVQ